VLAAGALVATACSQPPYTAEDGRTDLIEAGFGADAADCVVAGLDDYFREEFLAKQQAEGITGVPEAQVDNYVKNRFAGVTEVPQDLADEADRIVAECRDQDGASP
jgi:hypothetical protein